MTKKRAMITVDAEQWDSLQEELREREYPANSMSIYLGACLDSLEYHLDGEPHNLDIPPVYQLEIHRKGLKATMQDMGLTVVEEDPSKNS